jgi:hypothetical protein
VRKELKRHVEEAFGLAHSFVKVREDINKSGGTFKSLFKKVDFQNLLNNSETINSLITAKAEEVATRFDHFQSTEDEETKKLYTNLCEYTSALREAADILLEKTQVLNERAQNRRQLEWHDFSDLTKREIESLKKCQMIGDKLTELFYRLY